MVDYHNGETQGKDFNPPSDAAICRTHFIGGKCNKVNGMHVASIKAYKLENIQIYKPILVLLYYQLVIHVCVILLQAITYL